MASWRSSSLAVFILGMAILGVLLYLPAMAQQKFVDNDDIEYTQFTCAPANAELKFGYNCADIWEAEKIARADDKIAEIVNGQEYHLIGYAFVDDAGPHGVSPTSQNPTQYPFLNFFVEGDDR